jgi:peptidoglycan hydrolase-like protein with peptidoglycan-binding domain
MSTPEQRRRMAAAIINFEARRDNKGRLKVHKLLPEDGGGRYEVAGINERYNKETCDALVGLIEARRFDEAEALAIDFIAQDTDRASSWSNVPALEFFFRDCVLNRGGAGGARIVQRALGVKDDGAVGAETRAALAVAEQDAAGFLVKLRAAREDYERKVARRDETSPFWKGLVNRWNKAVEIAKTFPVTASVTAAGAEAATLLLVPEPTLTPPAPPPVVLPAMRIGMRDNRIAAWQAFLRGKGFDVGITDGVFGEATRDATIAFQKKHKVEADGVVGRQTLLKAMALGFEVIEEPADDITSSNFPPRPSFPALIGTARRQAVFGRFDFVSAPRPSNTEAIRILGSWERDNIASVPVPQLRKALGSKAPSGMQFHKRAAAQLQGLWAEWEQAKLLDRVMSYEGAYVPRFIRGSRTSLSNHAFGSAFDINARFNGLGVRPALVGQKGCVRELVPIAHRWGFYWGGHFQGRPDGMHFEVAFVK